MYSISFNVFSQVKIILKSLIVLNFLGKIIFKYDWKLKIKQIKNDWNSNYYLYLGYHIMNFTLQFDALVGN